MDNHKVNKCKKMGEQLRKSAAQKFISKVQSSPMDSEIDTHKWVSKMEVFRLLSS